MAWIAISDDDPTRSRLIRNDSARQTDRKKPIQLWHSSADRDQTDQMMDLPPEGIGGIA